MTKIIISPISSFINKRLIVPQRFARFKYECQESRFSKEIKLSREKPEAPTQEINRLQINTLGNGQCIPLYHKVSDVPRNAKISLNRLIIKANSVKVKYEDKSDEFRGLALKTTRTPPKVTGAKAFPRKIAIPLPISRKVYPLPTILFPSHPVPPGKGEGVRVVEAAHQGILHPRG